MSDKKNVPRKKPISKSEKLEQLLIKEKQLEENVEIAKGKLQVVRNEIADTQKEIGGLEFLKLRPDEFLRITKNLEEQKIPVGEILKLLSDGDFMKLQEIYDGMKNTKGGS